MHRSEHSRARTRSAKAALCTVAVVVALIGAGVSGAQAKTLRHTRHRPPPAPPLVFSSIDGSGNNPWHSAWGAAGTDYVRDARTNYADGVSAMVSGPNARYISNRIFNDIGQNVFSENNISQWGWAWGQFLDHDMGLRDETPAEDVSVPFDASDPLESYANGTGSIAFNRTPAAPGTGVSSPRQQVNSLSSYLDASNVYGVTAARASWLRNPDGTLMLPDDYLPKEGARGDATTAPAMDDMGPLAGDPADAVVAGDVRANENIALTAIQTLFAREHNRIVASLPSSLTGDQKYDIARTVVGAEVQYITYNEFLPALGVRLGRYRGYDPHVNASISDEFATVGYRAHSMVHGEFDVDFDGGEYSAAQLSAFAADGIAVTNTPTDHSLTIPLSVAFGNPDLLAQVGLGSVLAALGGEHEYKNDEQIDNTMRSVLFEVPKPGTTDPTACQTPVVDPRCFTDVSDLGVDDVMRGRDHGMPTYNDLRRAYGLRPVRSFTEITGEATDQLPAGLTINNPHILDFTQLLDAHGHVIDPTSPDAQEDAVTGIRRTTLAARLKAIYGNVNNIDAFVGMVSEKHIPGTEFGPLQLAMWNTQFTRLRDGDRFFYANNPALDQIAHRYGVTYQHTLADIITLNTGTPVDPDVFHATDTAAPAKAKAKVTAKAKAKAKVKTKVKVKAKAKAKAKR